MLTEKQLLEGCRKPGLFITIQVSPVASPALLEDLEGYVWKPDRGEAIGD